jgi:hypothetical protein
MAPAVPIVTKERIAYQAIFPSEAVPIREAVADTWKLIRSADLIFSSSLFLA